MMGKISLGFAVIPNLTQTIISTMTDLGFTTGLKAIAKAYGPTADAGLRDVKLFSSYWYAKRCRKKDW